MTLESAYRSLIDLYRHEKPLARFHVGTRYRRARLEELLGHVPPAGSILEIGCGHGAFANLLSLTSPGRRITGIDISEEKIAVARRTVGDRKNIDFIVADAERYAPEGVFDLIAIIETLYLIPYDVQERIFKTLSRCLREGGLLMFSEVCRDRSLRFRKALLQETIAVKLLKITAGRRFYYRSVREWRGLAEEIGFSVQVIRRSTPNPTHLFLCRRGQGGDRSRRPPGPGEGARRSEGKEDDSA